MTRIFNRAAAVFACLGLAAVVAPTGSGAVAPPGDGAMGGLVDPVVTAPVLPADPQRAFVAAVEALGAAFGTPVDAAGALPASPLADPLAGRLALLVAGTLDCYRAASPAREAIGPGLLLSDAAGFPVSPELLRPCATRLHGLSLELSRYLQAHPAAEGGGMDLWPVLHFSPGESDDRYLNDYAVVVDQGGDDTYLNNAGGNLLDLMRGPEGSPAPQKAPARGCQKLPIDYLADCFNGVAVLVDAAGNDTYGERVPPDPADDGFCTSEPLVLRIMIAGGAFGGVGILVDSAGDDSYVGKTNTQGAGHIGGIGILRDEAGDDSYLALRSSQGYGIVGIGVLADDAGDDTFDFYTLAPLDPNAAYQRPGSGGVVDDRGTCDALTRQLQGTGFLPGGIGILKNTGGADSYRAAAPAIQRSDAFMLPHGSQGFGGNGGFGYFVDEGGRDSYAGVPNRYDDLVVKPSPDSSGIFEDKGSIEGGGSGTPK